MTDSRDNLITMAEIQRITQHCMNLLSCTARLRQDESSRQAYVRAEKLRFSIRKLLISSLMYRKTLICVTGLQQVGKTTLMKNFYGLNDRYLRPAAGGRGERIPILITEKKGLTAPTAWAIRVEEDGKEGCIRKEIPLSEEGFAAAAQGTDDHIMYLELCVPFRHTNDESVSFLLLPGFDKKDEYWNDLIEFSVNSSDAAVFVFREDSFSHADNESRLKEIEERFGENLVYAITNSDTSKDGNAAVKETCLQTLRIPFAEADRVVCTGEYPDNARNDAWIAAFKKALERYAYNGAENVEKNSQYLYREVKKITDSLWQIRDILDQADDTVQIGNHHNNAMLRVFDQAVGKQRKQVEKCLEEQFRKARAESIEKLREQFANAPKTDKLKQLFGVGNGIKQYQKTIDIIENSLRDGEYSLPAKHLGLALQGSLTALDQPKSKTELGRLMDGDVKRNDKNQLQLVCGELTQAVVNDVRVLLVPPEEGQTAGTLQCREPKRLMRSMAELGTYYFSLMSYDGVVMETGLGAYEPASIGMVPDHMLKGAASSKKFVAGMAGMIGVDLLGDGTINMVSQIAASLGVAAPVAGAVAIAMTGVGAVAAIASDLTRMQREDFNSASLVVREVYDNLRLDVLEKYDLYMENIRDRMEENIDVTHQSGKQIIDIFNAQREITNALDLLETISARVREENASMKRWG